MVIYSRALGHFRSGLGRVVIDEIETGAKSTWRVAKHGGIDVRFLTPNSVCDFRARTFATKEPETLEWIDRLGGGRVLYDVGANVGLYSVYYAKRHETRVYAFEPSLFNLDLLAQNVYLNGVAERVAIVPLPLAAREEVATFRMTTIERGGALSSFAENVGFDGRPLEPILEYLTVGASLDFLCANGLIPDPPGLLKIDVDGTEEQVLKGAARVLEAPSLVSVLIEVNSGVSSMANPIHRCLREHGFIHEQSRISGMFADTPYAGVRNEIWIHPVRLR